MKLIYIEWEDAHARSGWHTEEEMESYHSGERAIVKEIGWVYKENPQYLTLYSRVIDWKEYNDTQYGLLQKIPKTWIRKRKTIKL